MIKQFWDKIELIPFHSCWEWVGNKNYSGYGTYNKQRAHRLVYKLLNGEIPNGMHILHKCDNRACVRPEHLYAGTHTDNMKDKVNKGRDHNKSKTHCINGHEYSGDNLIIKRSGERRCRECHNAQLRSLYWRRRLNDSSTT